MGYSHHISGSVNQTQWSNPEIFAGHEKKATEVAQRVQKKASAIKGEPQQADRKFARGAHSRRTTDSHVRLPGSHDSRAKRFNEPA